MLKLDINRKFAKLYLKTLRTLRNSLRALRLKKSQNLSTVKKKAHHEFPPIYQKHFLQKDKVE